MMFAETISANNNNLMFRRLTVRDGLSGNLVNCIYKDSRGFLWIGTIVGLNRYDGFRVKNFFKQHNNPKSLPNNNVTEIFEDGENRLWIRTSVGYCIYDHLTETFDYDINKWAKVHGINAPVWTVGVDSKRNLLIETEKGCYYYDIIMKKSYYMSKGSRRNNLPKLAITSFGESKNNIIISFDDGSLVCADFKHNKVCWKNNYISLHGGENHKGYHLYVDSKNNFWIYTGDRAWLYLDRTKTWSTLPYMVKDVKQGKNGKIWMATDHDGLMLLDTNGKVLNKFMNDPGNIHSISDNTLPCLFLDKEGTIWVGTYSNGITYHYEGQTTFDFVSIGDICTIIEGANGTLWCGSNDKGIICYNRNTGAIENYTSNETHMGSNIVICSLYAHDGSLWFGSYRGGLSCFKNGQFHTYRKSDKGLKTDDIWTLAEGRDGKIYIGTLGAGLQVLDPKTDTFTTYNNANSGLQSDYVSSICFNTLGNLVIGHSQHFSILDLSTNKITNYNTTRKGENFISPTVSQVFCDSRGLLWLATASGLNVYDETNDKVYNVSILSSSMNVDVNAITEDRQGTIWISSSDIISCIRIRKDNEGWSFVTNSFTESDGLQSGMFNKRSILTTSQGDVVFGGFKGLSIVSPLSIISKNKSTNVIFSGLMLFDHLLSVGEEFNDRIILKQSLNENHKLNLSYSENAFTIQLASSNLAIPERCRFLYRLKGFNDRWMMTAEGQPTITYTNLESGSYELEVKAIDYNGNSISPVSTLYVTITPPFYRSLWAYLFYLSVILVISFYIRRIIIKRQEQTKKRLEVEKQKKIEDLKQLFFINVSHELRTPLTLILSPLASIITKETDENIRIKLKQINRNALKLLEMINQMLDLRRLMVNGDHLIVKHGDIVECVKGICDQFQMLSDKPITFTFYSSVSHLMMDFDMDKMTKIINNLLSNAYKFTPDNGRVDLSMILKDGNLNDCNDKSPIDTHNSQMSDDDKDKMEYLQIKVSDNGVGISDKDKEHLFERFYQANNHTNVSGGSGIGLNIVKEYAEMHGGNAKVIDNQGGGSIFIINIPAKNVKTEGDDFVEAIDSEDVDLVDTSNKSSETVKARPVMLLVDDSDEFLKFMTSEMCDDYVVYTAKNGVQALNILNANDVNIIITDVMMPEMDGNELCRCVKSDPKTAKIPVIMLTAQLSEEKEIQGMESGADDYITKPFNLEILRMHIHNLTKWNKASGDGKLNLPISQTQITPLDEQMVKDATLYVEKNISDTNLSVVTLSEALNMSRVKLYRKLLAVTGKTPSDFIRMIRLKHAEQLLKKSQLSVSEVCYKVGFSNPRYFSKCFKDEFGYMPSKYKRKL